MSAIHLPALIFLLAGAILLSGCAGQMSHWEGKNLMEQGKLEDGLGLLEKSTQEAPSNLEFKMAYINSRDRLVSQYLGKAQRSLNDKDFEGAEAAYRKVLTLDPSNGRAQEAYKAIDKSRRHAALLVEVKSLLGSGNSEGADNKLAIVLLEDPGNAEAQSLKRQIEEQAGRNQVLPPSLKNVFHKPISLEFRDASLKNVIESLSRHTGLNFVLDKDIPANLVTTLFLRNVSVDNALDVILTTNQLGKQILNETTLLIYPNTAAKQSERQELVVKSFYLSNTNAKQVMEMLKAILKIKNIYIDEKLNLLIMRDTPSAIRLAEQLVAIQDVPEAEVMLNVEIVEVQRNRMQQLGIQFPDQLTLTPLPTGTTLTLADLKNRNSTTTGASVPSAVINLHKDISDTNILANPRIRTHNKEKAEIKIGDRVPVITTTATATGFVSENVQFVDVGLKLNVEPTIYPDNEIAIKIALEVSSIIKEITSQSGSLAYQIGSRNATTTIRLKDGETQILGGLINDLDRTTANRVPGLGDLPILGRLFSSQKDDAQKTELVLSITPRLIRGIAAPVHVPTEFWSGTENNLRLRTVAASSTAQTPSPMLSASTNDKTGGIAQAIAPIAGLGSTLNSVPDEKAPTLTWDGPAQVKVGGGLKLGLKVSSQAGVASFPIQIKYDATVLEMVDISQGDFMARGGTKSNFSKRIVSGSGIAFVTQSSESADLAKGDGKLIEVEFKALKPTGNTLVSLLPATALSSGSRPLQSSGPALIGIAVTP